MSVPKAAAAPETELKFEIGPEALAALRQHPSFQAEPVTSRLRSVYFDTPDHDLRNAGLSLRVRQSGDGFVQTVKARSGAALFRRDEWETPVEGEAPDPAAIADTPVAKLLNGDGPDGLAPVFATTVERAVRVVHRGLAVIELSVDEGEVSSGDRREPLRELELELKSGAPDALFGLAQELSQSAALRLSFESKAERGYRLAGHDGRTPLKAERSGVEGEASAMDALRRVVRGALVQISVNAEVLRHVRRPEALHQARVGLRRLRSALTAFHDMIAGEALDRIKGETKWLAGEFDEARDLDVFISDTFRPAEETVGDDLAMAALGKRLLQAQARAYDRAVAAIDSERFSRLLLDIAAWAEIGTWSTDEDPTLKARRDQPAASFAVEALAHLRKVVRRKGAQLAELDPATRHKLRIKVKKLRYAVDMFADAFPEAASKRQRKFTNALKALQGRLGELNDVAVARDVAMNVLGARSSDMAFTAGLLVGGRKQRQAEMIDQAVASFQAFEKAKPFW